MLPSSSSSSSSSSTPTTNSNIPSWMNLSANEWGSILDFTNPLNVEIFDRVVTIFYKGYGQPQQQASLMVATFQDHPESWTRAAQILEQSNVIEAKFVALQILQKLIQSRWNILPQEQREGIRNYVTGQVIRLSSMDQLPKPDRQFLYKLNLVLVQILKQDWPHNWPTFIPEIVASSRTSIPLCENNMFILKLLSEEIFDFSAEQMTQVKARTLKNKFCGEFSEVFQLCVEVLEKASKVSLLQITLSTLLRFLNWIPLGYIYQTNLIQLLTTRYLEPLHYRNITLKCLTEIAQLDVGQEYHQALFTLFTNTLQGIQRIVPATTDFPSIYANADDETQSFLQNLALFFTTLLNKHISFLEPMCLDGILVCLTYLMNLSRVEERELFKVCLEFWASFVAQLYNEMHRGTSTTPPSSSSSSTLNNHTATMSLMNASNNGNAPTSLRKNFYAMVLNELRLVMIEKMVKPEEVLVVENEEGCIVRESMKEVDTIVLYKSMRQVLVYLTHLDPFNTEEIMVKKLHRQTDGSEWSWANVNKLCWAIGSISGAMQEDHERNFLVCVLKELLGLVDLKRGKDNKAVIASNIMYIVGQYPRFLKSHWRFLKTVVKKLFEFMHESHEGVQDMACDTFIKITRKTRRLFTEQQLGESSPFIEDILAQLPLTIIDLQPQQIQVFYQAVGYILHAQTHPAQQERLIDELFKVQNDTLDQFMAGLSQGQPWLHELESVKKILQVLRLNTSACYSIGAGFRKQFHRNYVAHLTLYRSASQVILTPNASRLLIRQVRAIKKEILRLVEVYVRHCQQAQPFALEAVPALLDACLSDYANNPPALREAEVLHVIAHLIQHVGKYMFDQIQPILAAVFSCTLEMINKELIEYPEHRTGFFNLLNAVVEHTFQALLKLPSDMFLNVMNSIVWGFKHTMRDIANQSLRIVSLVLTNMIQQVDPPLANLFYKAHYLSLLQDILVVLTDFEHKAGFAGQTTVLAQLMNLVTSGQVHVPLAPSTTTTSSSSTGAVTSEVPNVTFVRDFLLSLLTKAFPHMTPKTIQVFVLGLMELNTDLSKFKPHVRDFLIQLQSVSAGQAEDYYLEEREHDIATAKKQAYQLAMQVPGLIQPNELVFSDEEDDMNTVNGSVSGGGSTTNSGSSLGYRPLSMSMQPPFENEDDEDDD